MKYKSVLVGIVILISLSISAQKSGVQPDSLTLMMELGLYKPMSADDSVRLANLPELKLPDAYSGPAAPLLPPIVDNSEFTYFRPVFQQAGYACGQAAGVGYNFTYEMNRRRDVPGDLPENQYPTHFVWNWMNSGNNYGGVSYLHSFEVLRAVGTPNVESYGGMSAGGEKRWMTGYDDYYDAMHNRIENVYAIRVHTIEGLLTFKNWLNDHLEGTDAGGVGSFYANQPQTWALPQGTPEAGKRVAIGWAPHSSHALTIVGYHDSICWDYNSDGEYTNDIDINGDGVVDIKDWEIGGFKFVNSYGGVPGWGDEGFCYMMYKTVAEKYGEGGIWNNTVHVLNAKEDLEPQLTMKIKIEHNCRKLLKVSVGVAGDPSASAPEYVLGFPILDYQGACLYMQGGSTLEDKTIEFGLDITPLLNYVDSGQEAKFFLFIDEDDPSGTGSGEFKKMSIIDYTNGIEETICADSNISIPNNGNVTVSILGTVLFEDVIISSDQLPAATIYEPYSEQLTAEQGTHPYTWKYKIEYNEVSSIEDFPEITAEELIPNNITEGYAVKILEFPFPFYGKLYDTIYVYTDGFLKFDDQLVTWPYFQDKFLRFRKNKNIGPFFDVNLRMYTSEDHGLWYEGDEEYAIFRWKVAQNDQPSSVVNVAVKLFPDGKIEFYYGNIDLVYSTTWYAGVANGDAVNYQLNSISNSSTIPENHKIEFEPPEYPFEMELSTDGVFSGTPVNEYNSVPVEVVVTDNNNISASKTLSFSTEGLMSSFVIHSGDNDTIEFGETVTLDVMVKNIGSSSVHDANMIINTDDSFTILNDSTENLGTIHANQTNTALGAFSFTVADTVPNEHQILMHSEINANEGDFERDLVFTAYSPIIRTGNISVEDGNNEQLEPGETADLILTLENLGGASLFGIAAFLSSVDPFVTINTAIDTIAALNGNSSQDLTFNVTTSPQTPDGHILFFNLELTPENYPTIYDSIYLNVGFISEDFETADFSKFPWYFGGDGDWTITNFAFEGDFSARSGIIGHLDESILLLDVNVLSDSYISFYKWVSSENNYDLLIFYIDGANMGSWSGSVPWEKSTFPITKGNHTLKWNYKKDINTVGGQDRAQVDNIILPPISNMLITVNAGPNDTICENETHVLDGYVYNAEAIHWETTGSGTFDNDTILNPVYTPGLSDILSNGVVLSLYGENEYGREVGDHKNLFINRFPIVNAGPDTITCEDADIGLSGEVNFTDSSMWTTLGDGSFDFPYSLTATYSPGQLDVENGVVNLILTGFPNAPCEESISDTLILNFSYDPIADAGEDDIVCENGSYILSGSIINSNNSLWVTLGDGSFDDPSLLNATYTPGNQDITTGTAELILIAYALYPCEQEDQDNILLTIEYPPIPYAGEDQTIGYYSSTTLSGSASGGSGDYSWHWTPEAYLIDPEVQNPTTTLLTSTVTYQLVVTDNTTGCLDSDEVIVNIEGTPFEILVTADPEDICLGDMTQLFVNVDGNTGPYTYSWTSDPEGFDSDIQDPIAYPEETTTFYVVVTDSKDSDVEGFVTVEVFPPPTVDAGEDDFICENESFTLNSSATNYSSITWTTSGDGSFDDNTILNPVYTPGENDIIYSNVQLTILCGAVLPCAEAVSDNLVLGFNPTPEVTFADLPDFCNNDPPYLLVEGNPTGGIYDGNGVIDGYFYPEIAGFGEHTLTYTYTDNNSCSAIAEQIAFVDECTGIGEINNILSIQIIPNPNDGRFSLHINSRLTGEYQLTIIDTYDRKAHDENLYLLEGENKFPIWLDNLKGLYVLIIQNENQTFYKKILIQ